jgi:hypothetical protein
LAPNAIYAMAAKEGARVLRVRSERGGVIISVADTGTGIGAPELDRIFDPLFTTKSGGMGMGLAICRSIIEAHDGRLWVVPNKPEGAVFQFMLRADGATSARASRREQPDDLPPSSPDADETVDDRIDAEGKGSTGWTGGARDQPSQTVGQPTSAKDTEAAKDQPPVASGADLKGPTERFPAGKTPE